MIFHYKPVISLSQFLFSLRIWKLISLSAVRTLDKHRPAYQSDINLLSFIHSFCKEIQTCIVYTCTNTHAAMLSSWQWISSCLYYLSKLVKCDSALKILCEFLYFQFINPFTFDILGTCVVYCPPNVKLDCYTGLFCTFSIRAAVRAVGPLNGL